MIPLFDNLSCKKLPIVTMILICINILVFGYQLILPDEMADQFIQDWALTPSHLRDAWLSGDLGAMFSAGVTVFTSMFMHGGFMHILGNMVFLQAFGRAVEARFGSVRFLCFYILGGVAACWLHIISGPMSSTPLLGASGAIAAVIGGYLLFWPKAKFRTLIIVVVFPLFVNVRAYILIGIWFLLQLVSSMQGLMGEDTSQVAYLAHVGGVLTGVIMASLYAFVYPLSTVCEVPLPVANDCNCPAPADAASSSESEESKAEE